MLKLHSKYRNIALPLAGVAVVLLMAILAPLITDHLPVTMDIANRLKPPSADHLLGQDEYGRDIFARLLYGARVSIAVALFSALAAGVLGITLGIIGGYFGGLAELATVRLADIILSVPPILLALLIVTILGPGIETLGLVLTILYTPGYARVAYGETLSVRSREFVEAARALGSPPWRILMFTIFPNILGPLIVQFSLTVASAVLIESGLSFLGLGVVPPDPSWGLMIRSARAYMVYTPMPLLWPCLALTATVLAVNALCDALRDFYDPRAVSTNALASIARSLFYAPLARNYDAGETDAERRGALLSAQGLRTEFITPKGRIAASNDVSFDVAPGETVALVGESGSGKTITGLSIMGLVPGPLGAMTAGSVSLKTKAGGRVRIEELDESALQAIRGEEIAMVFQEPMSSLNPVYPVGEQIAEGLRHHRQLSRAEAMRAAVELLDSVGIADAQKRATEFPHQMSGGMQQRVMIAMALSCEPSLIIADEPTTALDVTIQAQILDLLRNIRHRGQHEFGMLFITHNLGVVAEIADRVLVMYCGRIVEQGPVAELFRNPAHPYTQGLLASMPQFDHKTGERQVLYAIEGTVPPLDELPSGCAFAPRCSYTIDACRNALPELVEIGHDHFSRCLRWQEIGS
jgi:peptide/nickel transport system permease protein